MSKVIGLDGKPIKYGNVYMNVTGISPYNIAWPGTKLADITPTMLVNVTNYGVKDDMCYINYTGEYLYDFVDFVHEDDIPNLEWLYVNCPNIKYAMKSDKTMNTSAILLGNLQQDENFYIKNIKYFKKFNTNVKIGDFTIDNVNYNCNTILNELNNLIKIDDNMFNFNKDQWSYSTYSTNKYILLQAINGCEKLVSIGNNCFNFEKQDDNKGLYAINITSPNYHDKLEYIGKNCFNGIQYGEFLTFNPNVYLKIDDNSFNDLENRGFDVRGGSAVTRIEWNDGAVINGYISKIGNNCFNKLNYANYHQQQIDAGETGWSTCGRPICCGCDENFTIGDNCFNSLDYCCNFVIGNDFNTNYITKLTSIGNFCFNNLKECYNFFYYAPDCTNFGVHCFENLEVAHNMFVSLHPPSSGFDGHNIENPGNLVFPKLKDASSMFESCKKLKTLGNINLSNLEITKYMLYDCESFCDPIIQIIEYLKSNKPEIFDIEYSKGDAPYFRMFYGCVSAPDWEEAKRLYPTWCNG